MTSQSVKELIEELNRNKTEVSALRNSLNELDKDKESWFRKKQDISNKIKYLIQKIKENISKRDTLNAEVKNLKPKRDSLNKEITEKLKQFDNLKKEKINIAKSSDIKESPSSIKHQIEKLEFKMETEPMAFDKEQSLMKKIKELKRQYEDASILNDANKKLKNASDEIKMMRQEANQAHRLIQEKANQSQILHEEILKISGEIDKAEIEEEDAFKKFSELRKKFYEINSELKEKLKVMNELKNALDKISSDKREKKRQEVESFLKSKEEQVNEKLKRGEKLTTEDLLVFQNFNTKK